MIHTLKTAIVAIILLAILMACAGAASAEETTAERDARMAWWRDARFGMFIHWGVYSVPAGVWKGQEIGSLGEWIMCTAQIPMAEYQPLTKQFNPVKFNADEWVRLAKDTGMKYVVITSKHHDGFAMFRSATSDFNIYDATPFKRDPLKELAEACRKHGLKLGFYYSQAQDWNHPGGATCGGYWDKNQEGDMDEYIRKVAVPQVQELLTNYGPIAILWWDTACGMTKERADMLLPLLKLQPGIITNNRLGHYRGDTETPEQTIPARGFVDRDWETCMTLNDTWGFKSTDHNWKTPETLIRNLIDIASKGGNYLLNVGPTSEGVIPPPSVELLREVGRWMKVNSQAIYGTSASPFENLPWGRCTRKPGKLYLHVFDWPADSILRVPMTGQVKRAYLLANRRRALKVTQETGGIAIALPATAPDKIATVVVLDVTGDVSAMEVRLSQADNGSIVLDAVNCSVKGSSARLEGSPAQNVGYWVDANDYVQWEVEVTKPGEFAAEITYSCSPDTAGAEFAVACGESSTRGKVEATGGWGDYRTMALGKIKIDKPGQAIITVKPITKPGMAVMNLRKVRLAP